MAVRLIWSQLRPRPRVFPNHAVGECLNLHPQSTGRILCLATIRSKLNIHCSCKLYLLTVITSLFHVYCTSKVLTFRALSIVHRTSLLVVARLLVVAAARDGAKLPGQIVHTVQVHVEGYQSGGDMVSNFVSCHLSISSMRRISLEVKSGRVVLADTGSAPPTLRSEFLLPVSNQAVNA